MTTIPLIDAGTFKGAYSPGLDPVNDATLERILIAATEEIYRKIYPRILVEPATAYVENHDGARAAGRARDEIWAKHYPITSITSVKENGVALVTASGYTTSADVLLYAERGSLMRRPGSTIIPISGFPGASGFPSGWSSGFQNIELTYKGGFPSGSLPADIVQRCIELAAKMLREPSRSGDESFSRSVSGSASNSHDMPDSWHNGVMAYAPWGRPRTWAA